MAPGTNLGYQVDMGGLRATRPKASELSLHPGAQGPRKEHSLQKLAGNKQKGPQDPPLP